MPPGNPCTTPLLILILRCRLGGWVLLTLVGGERTRRLGELRVQRPTSASPSPTLLSAEPRHAGIARHPRALARRQGRPVDGTERTLTQIRATSRVESRTPPVDPGRRPPASPLLPPRSTVDMHTERRPPSAPTFTWIYGIAALLALAILGVGFTGWPRTAGTTGR